MVRKHPLLLWFTAFAVAATISGCAERSTPTEPPAEQNVPEVTEDPLELVRVTGTVVSGAEPGCLLLDNGVRRYHLVGGEEAALSPGQTVTVTGMADPNTTSACEQTTPLTINEVVTAG